MITKQDEQAQALLDAAAEAGLDGLADAIYERLIGDPSRLTDDAADRAASAIANGRGDEAMEALGLN